MLGAAFFAGVVFLVIAAILFFGAGAEESGCLGWGIVALLSGLVFVAVSVAVSASFNAEGRAWSTDPDIPEVVRVIQTVEFATDDGHLYVVVNNGMDSGCEPRLIRTRLEGTSLAPGDLITVKDGKVKVVGHEAEMSEPKAFQVEASGQADTSQ